MKVSKIWIFSFLFCLGLNAFSFGQNTVNKSQDDAVEKLRKGLEKYSRYQFQNITISFKPIKFSTCEVEYNFISIESIGEATTSSSTTSSPLDSYLRTRNEPNTFVTRFRNPRTDEEKAERIKPGRKNIELNKINEQERSRTSVTGMFNLADLDTNSFLVKKLPTGTFLEFKIKPNANPSTIQTEVFPIINKNKANKVKAMFIEAVNQCK